jgi:hypothetical protein
MVLSNASKAARHAGSLINRSNCGGTAKKSGLAKGVGRLLSSRVRANGITNTMGDLICRPSTTIQTQRYGYHSIGGI